ncbi:MAG: hypothetical protein R3E12_08825 [Candidatus Eisenbacteria bacterium]
MEESREPRAIADALWIESPFAHPTVMMRRSAYRRVGGYRDRGWPEDYDLWLRMNRARISMAKLADRLYQWTDRKERASRTLPEYRTDRFLACRAHHVARHLDRRSTIVWGAGRDGRRAARRLLEEGVEIEAFLDIDPRKIGRRVRNRPVWSVEEWLRRADRREPHREDPERCTRAALPTLTREHPIVLCAVGTQGARELIRAELEGLGWEEGEDFLCIA